MLLALKSASAVNGALNYKFVGRGEGDREGDKRENRYIGEGKGVGEQLAQTTAFSRHYLH